MIVKQASKSLAKYRANTIALLKECNTCYVLISSIAVLLVVSLPTVHLGVIYTYFLLPYIYKHPIDPDLCSNSCWDTVFKAGYENNPAGYKHVYFNTTASTLKIWVLTVSCIVCTYEVIVYLFKLALAGNLRKSMLILFLSNIYAHYYTWWSFFNYWNDDYYKQWYHQVIFSSTEILSTVFVLYFCDLNRTLRPHLLLVVVNIAAFHAFSSAGDQFITNIVFGEGDLHQLYRDIGLMIPDLLHIVIPLVVIYKRDTEYTIIESNNQITLCDILMPIPIVAIASFFCYFI